MCTKLVVPSTGSTIHVGVDVSLELPPSLTDSSPIKLNQCQIQERNIPTSFQNGSIISIKQSKLAFLDSCIILF